MSLPALLTPFASHPDTSALFLDFDGTLAAIVPDPYGARPLPGVTDLLARLAERMALVAIVSGRPTSFLTDVLGAPEGVALVGLYGLELLLDPDDIATWTKVFDEVSQQATEHAPEGVFVEPKGLTLTMHWRHAPGHEDWVHAFAARQHAAHGLEVLPARSSVELRPPFPVDKGAVVRALVERMPARPHAVGVFGDDVGDLPAFEAVGDLGIEHVVRVAVVDPESAPEVAAAADFTVDGATGTVALLEALIQALG